MLNVAKKSATLRKKSIRVHNVSFKDLLRVVLGPWELNYFVVILSFIILADNHVYVLYLV